MNTLPQTQIQPDLPPEVVSQLNDLGPLLSFKQTWPFRQFISLPHSLIGLFTGNQYGKCLEEHSVVPLKNGVQKEIRNILPGDEVVTITQDFKQVSQKVLEVIDSGIKDTVVVKTRAGARIQVTDCHPFLTVDGWEPVSSLGVGDYIATPRSLPCPGYMNAPSSSAVLAGYLIGDGGLTNGAIRFSSVDEKILEEIRSMVEPEAKLKHIGGCDYRIANSPGRKNPYIFWAKAHGLWGVGAHDKKVPEFVFRGGKSNAAAFLSRLYSCDGNVNRNSIEYTTVSRELADGVKSLLLRFGIVASLRKRKTSHTYNGEKKTGEAYRITVGRYSDIKTFADEIGIFSKQDALDALVKDLSGRVAKENRDTVPYSVNHLYSLTGGQDDPKYQLLRSARGKTITRDKLLEIGKAFNDSDAINLGCSDVFWDKIESIEPAGEVQTYDLHVEGTHNFVANGIYAHNTNGSMVQYIMRWLGIHPVPEKNFLYFECPACGKAYHDSILRSLVEGNKLYRFLRPDDNICQCGERLIIHERSTNTYRFGAEVLPGDKGDKSSRETSEVRNTIYPAIKRWLPTFLIDSDITFRAPVMTLLDVNAGVTFGHGENALYYAGKKIVAEFVSYNQSAQAAAGVQRCSVYCDEEPPWEFYEEQLPRLVAEDGDFIIGLTPANRICFDEKTEILTPQGWVGHEDIEIGMPIYTMDMERERIEVASVDGIYRDPTYSGEMISLKAQGFDALVTPEHRWPVKDKRSGKKLVVQTKDLKTHHKIYRALEAAEPLFDAENGYWPDLFVSLVGWYVTDGSAPEGRRQVFLYQSKSANREKCDEIDKILSGLEKVKKKEFQYHAGEPCEGTACKWVISGELADSLRRMFPNRELSVEFVSSLTKKQRQLLYDALVDGDGCRTKTNDRFRGTLKTVESFCALCSLMGRRATIEEETTKNGTEIYRANAQRPGGRYKPFTHVCSLKRNLVAYSGVIWCPHTKNDTVIAKRNGTIYISSNTWTYDEILERAEVYVRSKAICEYHRSQGDDKEQIELTAQKTDIAVVQAATDDNPTLNKKAIARLFEKYDDPDVVATRRYGIHKQVRGRIFKEFDQRVHVVDIHEHFGGDEHFPPKNWRHCRMIDFHEQNPWAILWCALSPENELFVYHEWAPSPDNYVTWTICERMARINQTQTFQLNLIDPLAATKQPNTGLSTLDDINRAMGKLAASGICRPCAFRSWDTRSTKGRDKIRERIKGSIRAGAPFANYLPVEDERGMVQEKRIPTIWIDRRCKETVRSMRQWRLEEWAQVQSNVNKEPKEMPAQKFSHFPMCLEAIHKDNLFRPPQNRPVRRGTRAPGYFKKQ